MKHGIVFGENIKTEKGTPRRIRGYNQENRERLSVLLIFLIVSFGVLVLRLGYLQFVKGAYYSSLADSNRTRTVRIFAPRGIIFDRNNNPLVFNVPGFRQTKDNTTKLLDNNTALKLIADGDTSVEVDSLRSYPYKSSLLHVLGYVGQISQDDLKNSRFSGYPLNSFIGKSGIEWQYEHLLKGRDGRELIEVDAMGKKIRTLGVTDPISGYNLHLTIDMKLQEAAYKAMSSVQRGSVIATTPQGEILAMVSKPTFDPNFFTQTNYVSKDGDYRNLDEVLRDNVNQPFLNRAIGGVYPPGSTFKIITSAVGLEEKVIDRNYLVEDTGVIRVNEFSFSNWYFTQYGGKDGMVDVVKALARSNDIFFYKLAAKIGAEKISNFSKRFGLGEKLGIDLPNEARGVMPSDAWKRKNIGEQWYLGDTYHLGIGQGYLLTTPLQVNSWTEIVANGGDLYKPHLLKSKNTKLNKEKLLQSKSIDLIRQGMINACSEGGTAWPFFEFQVKNNKLEIDNRNIFEASKATSSAGFKDYRRIVVACKTGTAQHGGEQTKPHAWITLFAPAYDPEIVLTVLVEEGGEGSSVAGPIAKKILETWFSKSD